MNDDLEGPVFCVNCRKPLRKSDVICPQCGRDQSQRAPLPPMPPQAAPPPPQYAPPPVYMPPPDAELIELSRQYKAAKDHAVLTFWIGLLTCVWPVWIWTYIANTKMEAIRVRVASKGVDAQMWVRQIYGRL